MSSPGAVGVRSGAHRLYAALVGVASTLILLQGLWAGIFLEHDGGRDSASSWIDLHARGADVAILLMLIATVFAFVRLRNRRDLWLGGAGLVVLLVLESFLGGRIRDNGQDALTAVHVPLAMALMGVAVWLSLRSSKRCS